MKPADVSDGAVHENPHPSRQGQPQLCDVVVLAESFHGPTLSPSMQHVQEAHPEMGIRGNREHRQFVGAIKKRDAEKATAVMRTHIGRTARHVSKGN